jgi:hypothetical protein
MEKSKAANMGYVVSCELWLGLFGVGEARLNANGGLRPSAMVSWACPHPTLAKIVDGDHTHFSGAFDII